MNPSSTGTEGQRRRLHSVAPAEADQRDTADGAGHAQGLEPAEALVQQQQAEHRDESGRRVQQNTRQARPACDDGHLVAGIEQGHGHEPACHRGDQVPPAGKVRADDRGVRHEEDRSDHRARRPPRSGRPPRAAQQCRRCRAAPTAQPPRERTTVPTGRVRRHRPQRAAAVAVVQQASQPEGIDASEQRFDRRGTTTGDFSIHRRYPA